MADVKIGLRTTIGLGCSLAGEVSVGTYCMLGPSTAIYSLNHPLTHLTTYMFTCLLGGMMRNYHTGEPVFIGHDVWTGYRALILPGFHVGNGAVVAAGAVVTRSVPPYSIVAGVPAKVVGHSRGGT